MRTYLNRFVVLCLLWCVTASVATAAPALKNSEEWLGVYFMGHKAGFVHSTLRVEGEELFVNLQSFMQLSTPAGDQVTAYTIDSHLGSGLQVKTFSMLAEVMGGRQKVDGRVANGQLELKVNTQGKETTRTLPFPEGAHTSISGGLKMILDGLEPGPSKTISVFDEQTQAQVEMEYEVVKRDPIDHNGKHYSDAVLIRSQMHGLETLTWVTPEGNTLLVKMLDGIVEMRAEDETTARDLGDAPLTISNLITLSMLPVKPPIQNPRERQELKLRLSNLPRQDIIPQDHRQGVTDMLPSGRKRFTATVRIRLEPWPDASYVTLPVTNAPDARFLRETEHIQSDHPRIRELAQTIVADETQAWRAALKINLWVHRNLKKALVDSFTALDVLDKGEGECQSHTLLFVALARAAGIPARIANGIVYSEEMESFLYHTWPEVFIGDWRALDPTFGQTRADATHLKLSEGFLDENFLQTMSFFGQLKLDLVTD